MLFLCAALSASATWMEMGRARSRERAPALEPLGERLVLPDTSMTRKTDPVLLADVAARADVRMTEPATAVALRRAEVRSTAWPRRRPATR